MTVDEMLREVSERWFLSEPAFYALYCRQQMQANIRMDCAFRCGRGRIEYNPVLLAGKTFHEVEQLMRIELIRLFLKHPYERQPEGCGRKAMSMGSDCTIADGYCFLHEKFPLKTPDFYHLPMGESYEWYAKQLQNLEDEGEHPQQENRDGGQNEQNEQSRGQNSGQNSGENNSTEEHPGDNNNPSSQNNDREQPEISRKDSPEAQQSELWRDDAIERARINELIENTRDWGSLPADVVERIKASTRARLDSRLVMQGFNAAILAQSRRLTRMRPNRRSGFLQMGSTRRFETRLLVAVDVSGSVTSEMLSHFYSTIRRIFRYGIVSIDTVQFDASVGEIEHLDRAGTDIRVSGRGGTSFQPVIDLVHRAGETHYDGLMIMTDGEAPPPHIPKRHVPLLWVLPSEAAYTRHRSWMEASGRACWLTL